MSRLISRALAFGLLTLLAACATAPKAAKNTSKTFTTVVVDAGHGGKDNGAYRRFGGAEKIATLDVAQRLERNLRESELKTVMTRSSDVFISLDERVAIENSQKNAIFVSIHFNDSRRRGIHGFETYYHSGNSSDLANRIQSKLMTAHRGGIFFSPRRHANKSCMLITVIPASLSCFISASNAAGVISVPG